MKDYPENIGKQINSILEKNIYAQQGFDKASKHTDNLSLAEYFRSLSAERKKFIKELRAELIYFKGEYEETGTADDGGWVDFKSIFTSDDESMLEEYIRGEKEALKEYDETCRPDQLPETTTYVLRTQYDKIQSGLIEVNSIEDLQ